MLQVEMGLVLREYIDRWGDKTDLAREVGINRATLYRLLGGKNAGTDTLLRVLRTLGRHDVLSMLLEPKRKRCRTPRIRPAETGKKETG